MLFTALEVIRFAGHLGGSVREQPHRSAEAQDEIDGELIFRSLSEEEVRRQLREDLLEGRPFVERLEQFVEEDVAAVEQLPGLQSRLIACVIERLGCTERLDP